jgi:hypothetical protein
MKVDLTRDTFHSSKHFVRVLMQQGRVQLDADWNEQAAILLRYLQTLAADLIGPAGGPADSPGIKNFGFEISPLASNPQADFRIGFGRYYVDGLMCEAGYEPLAIFPTPTVNVYQVRNWSADFELPKVPDYEVFDDTPGSGQSPVLVQISPQDKTQNQITILASGGASFQAFQNPKLRRLITYLHQPDYVFSSTAGAISPPPLPPASSQTVQIYLDVWERAITYAEDDSIREVALGGPDTAARSKLVWQVKWTQPAATIDEEAACLTPVQLATQFQPVNRGWLQAMAKQSSLETNPCIINPNSQYTGPENQLYRVEINRGGVAWDGSDAGKTTAATFKVSRENGSVFYPIVSGGGTNSLVLESLGRDDRFGLVEGDLVEVQDDRSVLLNNAGNLLPVQSVDRGSMTVTLGGTPDPVLGDDPSLHPLLRRWDQKAGDPAEGGLTLATDNAALVQEGVWLTLEDGVQIRFRPAGLVQAAPTPAGQSPPANQYRTGDYWLIPARTATGDVEWPKVMGTDGNPETDPQGNFIPLALPPHGILHHYAPLAVVTITANGVTVPQPDCRRSFPPLLPPAT